MMAAPLEWAYALFPLQSEGAGEELLPLEWVVDIAHQRIDRAEQTGDEAHFGPVLHWAHGQAAPPSAFPEAQI